MVAERFRSAAGLFDGAEHGTDGRRRKRSTAWSWKNRSTAHTGDGRSVCHAGRRKEVAISIEAEADGRALAWHSRIAIGCGEEELGSPIREAKGFLRNETKRKSGDEKERREVLSGVIYMLMIEGPPLAPLNEADPSVTLPLIEGSSADEPLFITLPKMASANSPVRVCTEEEFQALKKASAEEGKDFVSIDETLEFSVEIDANKEHYVGEDAQVLITRLNGSRKLVPQMDLCKVPSTTVGSLCNPSDIEMMMKMSDENFAYSFSLWVMHGG